MDELQTACRTAPVPDGTHRNLLLLTFDQFRGDWGDPDAPVIDLPNILGLADNGWSGRCYATSPQCVPARFSWTTGLYPSQLGVTRHQKVDLPGNAPSVIRELHEGGWWTELVGKSHLTAHVKGRDLRDNAARLDALGFDRVLEIAGPRGLRHVECALTDAWRDAGVLDHHRKDLERRYASGHRPDAWAVRPTVLPNELYPDIWLCDQAANRIEALPEDRPWILWVSLVGPHEPFDTPAPWSGRHADADLPEPAAEPDWISNLPPGASARLASDAWSQLDERAIRACRRDYADHLRLLDDQVGHLLRALDARSDAQRTAVALTADHGELLGDGGMLYKGTFLEGAVRVPWIYRPAPCDANDKTIRTNQPLGITPLLRACLTNHAEGGDVQRLLERSAEQNTVFCEYGDEIMAVSGNHKLVLDGRGRPLWATDLERDPGEQINLITANRRFWRRDASWKALLHESRQYLKRRRRRDWRVLQVEEVG